MMRNLNVILVLLKDQVFKQTVTIARYILLFYLFRSSPPPKPAPKEDKKRKREEPASSSKRDGSDSSDDSDVPPPEDSGSSSGGRSPPPKRSMRSKGAPVTAPADLPDDTFGDEEFTDGEAPKSSSSSGESD